MVPKKKSNIVRNKVVAEIQNKCSLRSYTIISNSWMIISGKMAGDIVHYPQDIIIPIDDNICLMYSHISSKNVTQLYNNKQHRH